MAQKDGEAPSRDQDVGTSIEIREEGSDNETSQGTQASCASGEDGEDEDEERIYFSADEYVSECQTSSDDSSSSDGHFPPMNYRCRYGYLILSVLISAPQSNWH